VISSEINVLSLELFRHRQLPEQVSVRWLFLAQQYQHPVLALRLHQELPPEMPLLRELRGVH
jgi:hypothetical protein